MTDLHIRDEDNSIWDAMSDDEEDEEWNKVAPGMDVNMRGPTVSVHDGKEWVHKEDYRRVKRKLEECLKQRIWDEECNKELNEQVSNLKSSLKFRTSKKGRTSLYARRKYFTPEDHINEANINDKVKELFAKYHHPPEGWYRYSANENTVAGHIMSGVTLSHGQDPKSYWDDFAGPLANRSWIDLRVIKDKTVSKICQGETNCCKRE